MLSEVVLYVHASDPVPVLSGVPQGSILGPGLFLIFINDLPDDDCILYRSINSITHCQILQDDLNRIAQWDTDWQMKFNVAKCHLMTVTQHLPSNQIHYNYTLHQQTLEQFRLAKYLGVTITDILEWGQHVFEVSCKSTKTFSFFFGAIWLLHLGIQRNLHTKISASAALVCSSYLAPVSGWRRKCSWQYARRSRLAIPGGLQSSLTFFYNIHSGTVSLDKDKYLIPAPNLRRLIVGL